MSIFTKTLILILMVALPPPIFAQHLDTDKIDHALGMSGQKIGEVYKVGFPRTDLHVSIHGLGIKPGLALGSWAAFTGTEDKAMVMGDLVLLEDEINPVMEKLRAANFEISAIHNHLIGETPHVMYLHYMGHGSTSQLAASLRAALLASQTPFEKSVASGEQSTPPSWVKTVEEGVGRKGTLKNGVLSFAVPRADRVTLDGMEILPAAGVAEAINFQEADTGNIATTGDFVLTSAEVNAVISELAAHHILVTGLHNHMLTEQPRLFFMHFWGNGSAKEVSDGIKAALDKIHTK